MSFIQPPFWASSRSSHQPLHTTATVVTAPADDPVSLDQAKARLKIFHQDDDDEITSLITAARLQVEKDLNGACLGTTVIDQWFDRLPNGRGLELIRWPVTAITTVKTYATDDVESTLATGDYLTDTSSQLARVLLNDDASWPTGLRTYRGVVVRYTCGFTSIPEMYTLAMLFLVAHWYQQREAVLVGHSSDVVKLAYEALLSDAPLTVA